MRSTIPIEAGDETNIDTWIGNLAMNVIIYVQSAFRRKLQSHKQQLHSTEHPTRYELHATDICRLATQWRSEGGGGGGGGGTYVPGRRGLGAPK